MFNNTLHNSLRVYSLLPDSPAPHSFPCRKSTSFLTSSDHGSITQFFSKTSTRKSSSTVCTLPVSQVQPTADVTSDAADTPENNGTETHSELNHNHVSCEGSLSNQISEPCHSYVYNISSNAEQGRMYASTLSISSEGHLNKPCNDIQASSNSSPDVDSEQNIPTPSGPTILSDHVLNPFGSNDRSLPPKTVHSPDVSRGFNSSWDEPDGGNQIGTKDISNMDEDQLFVTDLDLVSLCCIVCEIHRSPHELEKG